MSQLDGESTNLFGYLPSLRHNGSFCETEPSQEDGAYPLGRNETRFYIPGNLRRDNYKNSLLKQHNINTASSVCKRSKGYIRYVFVVQAKISPFWRWESTYLYALSLSEGVYKKEMERFQTVESFASYPYAHEIGNIVFSLCIQVGTERFKCQFPQERLAYLWEVDNNS